MNDELTRDFKGIWIPKDIWLDERLNTNDKIILMEIDSLDSSDDGCFASNEYLSNFCKCTEWKVSTSINKLVKLGYLEVVKFDGRKRYIKSRLVKIQRQTCENPKADLGKSKGSIYNNIDNNIINNKEYNIYGEFKNVRLTDEEYKKLEERKLLPYIEKLSSYIASKGKKYKSHYATILNWSRKEVKSNIKEDVVPDWFNKDLNNKENVMEENLTDEQRDTIKRIIESNRK